MKEMMAKMEEMEKCMADMGKMMEAMKGMMEEEMGETYKKKSTAETLYGGSMGKMDHKEGM